MVAGEGSSPYLSLWFVFGCSSFISRYDRVEKLPHLVSVESKFAGGQGFLPSLTDALHVELKAVAMVIVDCLMGCRS